MASTQVGEQSREDREMNQIATKGENIMSDKIILPSSDEAASIKTVTGWMSRNGRFFGDDEQLARYDGSTHRECSICGKTIFKHEYCHDCHTKANIEEYQKMERREWNGTDGLYSQAKDKWFWSYEELDDYIVYKNTTVDKLLLIIGCPVYAREIDPSEYYEGDLPDEGDLPEDLLLAFEELNKYIRESKIILSWEQGKFAASNSVGGVKNESDSNIRIVN